jgi:hypothetical protein
MKRKATAFMIFAKKARSFGDKRRKIGRKKVSRIFRETSPNPFLKFLKELFCMKE